MDVLKILFIAFLIMFPFAEVARLQFANGIAITLNEVLLAALVIFWGIRTVSKENLSSVKNHRLFWPLTLFTCSLILSLIVNIPQLKLPEIVVASLYLVRFIFYAALLFIVASFDNTFKKRIEVVLTYVGLAVVILGYVQYVFYQNLRNLYYLGWDEHLYRLFSTFLDPNFSGIFFVLYAVFLFGRFHSHVLAGKKNLLYADAIFTVLTFGALFLTYSRSALLALLFAGLLSAVFMKKIRLFFLVLLAVMLFELAVSKQFHVESINPFRIASSEARVHSAVVALQIIKENPVFGVGFNAYRYAQVRFGYRLEQTPIISHADASTDNSFLFVLATTGIVGFSAFVYLWFVILKSLHASVKQKAGLQSFVIVSLVSIYVVFVDSFFINSLFYPFIMEWLWILIGTSEST